MPGTRDLSRTWNFWQTLARQYSMSLRSVYSLALALAPCLPLLGRAAPANGRPRPFLKSLPLTCPRPFQPALPPSCLIHLRLASDFSTGVANILSCSPTGRAVESKLPITSRMTDLVNITNEFASDLSLEWSPCVLAQWHLRNVGELVLCYTDCMP